MQIRIGFDPVFLRLGGLELGWHALFTVIAVAVAYWIGIRGAKKLGLPAGPVEQLALWSLIGGIIGARLFHVLDHISYYSDHPLQALKVYEGGIAVYGAFIGGIAGGLITAWVTKLPVWPLLDVGAVGMFVGQAIGRLGCLANGDAWGRPTGGTWGLVYTNPGDLVGPGILGVPTHPYPIYEIAAVGLALGTLFLVRKRITVPGDFFLLAVIAYAAIRFGLTFFRQETVLFWGLQEAQVIALGTAIVAGAVLGVRLWTRRGAHPRLERARATRA